MKKTSKTNKAPLIGVIALVLVGIVAAGAFAMQFGRGNGSMGNDAVRQAILDGDYAAYTTAMEGSKRTAMNEDDFNVLVQHYQDMTAQRQEKQQQRDAMQAAIDSKDYNAWKAAVDSMDPKPLVAEKILNEDDFNTLVQMHEALTTAHDLATKLGLDKPGEGFGMGGGWHGKGMRNGGMHGMKGFGQKGNAPVTG